MREEQNRNEGDRDPNEGPFKSNRRLWLILIAVIGVAMLIPWLMNRGLLGNINRTEISYTAFLNQVTRGNVKEVVMTGEKIEGTYIRMPVPEGRGSQFTTYLPYSGDQTLLLLLENNDVEIITRPSGQVSFLGILFNILPFLLFIWILYSLFRARGGMQGQGIFRVGQSQAKRFEKTKVSTTFGDVAGVAGAKEELREIITFLDSPEQFEKLGAKTPRGILLVGPPGTGKTLLARAVAGEANVPFFSITGSDFMELFVGVGASRVRSLFKDAKKNSPSIIFIDELDSIGRHRGAGLGGGHDEREQTLNQLLSELDGFEQNESTIVIAATNRPDILDPALLRPGRFDRRVAIDLPTLIEREEILNIHSRNKPFQEGVNLKKVAQGTPGFSGADLENLLNEAALLTARSKKTKISDEEIDKAKDKVIMGLERNTIVLTPEEKSLIAYHESGHALVAAHLPETDPIHKVTIIPRARSLGATHQLPEQDRYLFEKKHLLSRLAVMLGGRAAESFIFGTMTTGAENDLLEATRLARKMILDWGMSDKMGHLALGEDKGHVFLGEEISRQRAYSEETAREVDLEIRSIIDQSFKTASAIIGESEKALRAVSEALLEKEELTGEEVMEIAGLKKP